MSDEIIKLNADKVRDVIEKGMDISNEIRLLQEDMKNLVEDNAKSIGVKPAMLRKAIRAANKASFQKTKEEMEVLESILKASGRE